MAREIKFRAWDKQNNEWIEQESLVMNKGLLFEDWRAFEDWIPLSEDEAELVEYTGLKDMHGVEICEGDIVKGCFETGRFLIGSIVYEKAIAAFVISPTDVPIFKFSLPEIHYPEIIGNIYENPELTEG